MKIFIEKKIYKNKKDRLIVVIPKKNVKKANKRNKIRRQIRAIFYNNHLSNSFCVKYFDINISPNFSLLQKDIIEKIKQYN